MVVGVLAVDPLGVGWLAVVLLSEILWWNWKVVVGRYWKTLRMVPTSIRFAKGTTSTALPLAFTTVLWSLPWFPYRASLPAPWHPGLADETKFNVAQLPALRGTLTTAS